MRADISDREIVTGYSNIYAVCDRSVVFADGSTGYSKLPWCSRVPVRARRILGEDVQIVFINRDRLDRSVSHHKHLARADPSFPSNFEHAVSRDKSIVRFSLYAPVIRCWLDHFDKANLHLVDFDVLTKDPLQAISPIRKKLGLPELYRSEDLQAPQENLGADQLLPPPSISGLVRRVTRSRAYKERLRQHVPEAVIRIVKSKAYVKPGVDTSLPNSKTITRLSSLFENDEKELKGALEV